jgi:hypothetical protein
MIEKHLDIATADGAMNSFVVHPEEGGPIPSSCSTWTATTRRT